MAIVFEVRTVCSERNTVRPARWKSAKRSILFFAAQLEEYMNFAGFLIIATHRLLP
jgi:hypothetical protein